MLELTHRLKFLLAFLREPHRWVLSGLAIALGTIALILASGFIEQMFVDFRESIVRSHLGHFQVRPLADESPFESSLPQLQSRIEQSLESFPGAVVTARLSFVGLASHDDRTVSFVGEGVEPAKERSLARALIIDEGSPLALSDENAALVGEGLARNLGVEVGDLLTVLVTLEGHGINAVELRVAGIFHTSTKAYDDRALRLPLGTAQTLLRTNSLSKLIGMLPETSDTDRAVSAVRAGLKGTKGVEVVPWTELADFYNKTVRLFTAQLDVVRLVIVAIVLLSVTGTLARNVMERTSEIGTMMALGRRRRDVAGLFIWEGLVLGVACAAIGAVAAWLLATLLNAVGIPMPPPPGTAHGFVTGIAYTVSIAVAAVLAVTITSVLASLLPAFRAARLDVVDALRAGR